MGWIGAIVIGVVAGWITGKVMRGSGYGFWMDLLLGLVGSMVGGWVSGLVIGVDLTSGFNLTTLLVSVLGAILVVAIFRLVTRRPVRG